MRARLPPDPDPAAPPPGGQPPPPLPPSAPPPPAERLLRRSHSERVLAGVCGGLGQYLGIDPVLLRIAFVVLAGVVFLLDALDVWRLRGDYVVPLVLILLGVAVRASGWAPGDRRP